MYDGLQLCLFCVDLEIVSVVSNCFYASFMRPFPHKRLGNQVVFLYLERGLDLRFGFHKTAVCFSQSGIIYATKD